MFGDDLIIGHTLVKMDTKGRIIIPAFTKAEKDDKLVIQKTTFENDVALRLYAHNQYLVILNKLQNLRNNATTLEEFEKWNQEISKIFFTLDSLVELDSQRRAQIPKPLLTDLNWSNDKEYQIDGLGDSLLISQKNK